MLSVILWESNATRLWSTELKLEHTMDSSFDSRVHFLFEYDWPAEVLSSQLENPLWMVDLSNWTGERLKSNSTVLTAGADLGLGKGGSFLCSQTMPILSHTHHY